jgi:hypothetical protein
LTSRSSRDDHFLFGLIFIKKNNQTELFFLKKKTETGSNRPVSVRFGFFREKTGSNRFDSIFPVLARFFSGFLSVSVRFGSVFFCFLFIKPKPNRTDRFFQKFNRFFFQFNFFDYFFFNFLNLISFLVSLPTPTLE